MVHENIQITDDSMLIVIAFAKYWKSDVGQIIIFKILLSTNCRIQQKISDNSNTAYILCFMRRTKTEFLA
jgi:hypothetical protein